MQKIKIEKLVKKLDSKHQLLTAKLKTFAPSAKAIILDSVQYKPHNIITIATQEPNADYYVILTSIFKREYPNPKETLLEATIDKSGIDYLTSREPTTTAKEIIYKYGRPPKYTDRTAEQIHQAQEQGQSIRQIAKDLQMSPTTVQKILKSFPQTVNYRK